MPRRPKVSSGSLSRDEKPVAHKATWTFLSNHAHVLLLLADDPELVMRDIAARVGITERAVQRIVADLEEGGYLSKEKDGRRNRYTVNQSRPLRHPIESHRSVASIISLIKKP